MTEKKEKKTEKKDAFSNVMIVQFVACAVILAVVFILCRADGSAADEIRSKYGELMSRDFSAADYKDAYGAVSSFIKGEKRKEAVSVVGTESKNEQPTGGADIASGTLDVLEGVSFDKYDIGLKFQTPVEDFYVSSDFGYRQDPIKGSNGVHTGIDLAATGGAEIKAAYGGVVVKSGEYGGYGNCVVISHGNGVETLYAHCRELVAEVGDNVDKGDVIALVGSTGNSTGNHLHFEIRKNGVKLDPSFALDL